MINKQIQVKHIMGYSRNFDIYKKDPIYWKEHDRGIVLDLRPIFQRGSVWPIVTKRLLIDSILEYTIPVPTIYLLEKTDDVWEIFDGKQRIESIISFIDNEFPYKDSIFFRDLSVDQQNRLKNYELTYVLIPKETPENELIVIFERLNIGSVKATSSQLRRSKHRANKRFVTCLSEFENPKFLEGYKKLYGKGYDQKIGKQLNEDFLLKTISISHMGNHTPSDITDCVTEFLDEKKSIDFDIGDSMDRMLYIMSNIDIDCKNDIKTIVLLGSLMRFSKSKIAHLRNELVLFIEGQYKIGATLDTELSMLDGCNITSKGGVYQKKLLLYMKKYTDSINNNKLHSRSIPEELRKYVLSKTNGRCSIDGCEEICIQIDHLVPYSKGGLTNGENLYPLCKTHNRHKSDISYIDN